MTQQDALEIFEVIKRDDINSFRAFLDKYKKLLCFSFGRFSILSTCYLFSSKKILRHCESEMILAKDKTVVYEPFELYNFFKTKSGKALRLFAGKQENISPFEMLAILGKDRKLKSFCKKYKHLLDEKTQQNIVKIYSLKEQKAFFREGKLSISHKKISLHQKKLFATICASVLLIVMLSSGVIGIVININGLGTKDNPKKIYNVNQLVEVKDKSDFYVRLMNDLTFSSSIDDFAGVIYGDGHTISMQENTLKPFFEKFSGTLENVKIACENIEKNLSNSTCLLTQINIGTLKNISLSFSGSVNIESENAIYFSLFANNNNGSMEQCYANINAQIFSNNASSFFSVFTTFNSGSVKYCSVCENSDLSLSNISASTVSIQNNLGGEILDCESSVEMSLSSTLSNSTPALSGIVIKNYGTIQNCINNSSLSLFDTSEDLSGSTYIGGVCVENCNSIVHSKNTGKITAETTNKVIYCGGITAHAQAYLLYTAQISNCAVKCSIEVSKENDNTSCFCGGIAGYMEGNITNTYSLATFERGYSESEKYIIGSAVGATSTFFQYVNISALNVLCLSVENVSLPLAYPSSVTGLDIQERSQSEIENSSIYW